MRALACMLLLAGCASAEKLPERPQIHVLTHKCDQWGVAQFTAVVTGPGVVSLQWDNAAVCGTPS